MKTIRAVCCVVLLAVCGGFYAASQLAQYLLGSRYETYVTGARSAENTVGLQTTRHSVLAHIFPDYDGSLLYHTWKSDSNGHLLDTAYSSGKNYLMYPGGTTIARFQGYHLLGDISGDGISDLVQVWFSDDGALNYWAWLGRADGGFSKEVSHGAFNLLPPGDVRDGVFLLGNFNRGGDGLAELMYIFDSPTVPGHAGAYIWPTKKGEGIKKDPPSAKFGTYDLGVRFIGEFHVGDVDGDGKADLIQTFNLSNRMAYFSWKNTSPSETIFAVQPSFGYRDLGPYVPGDTIVGDIDGDGRADLLHVANIDDQVNFRAWKSKRDGNGYFDFTAQVGQDLGSQFAGTFRLMQVPGSTRSALVQLRTGPAKLSTIDIGIVPNTVSTWYSSIDGMPKSPTFHKEDMDQYAGDFVVSAQGKAGSWNRKNAVPNGNFLSPARDDHGLIQNRQSISCEHPPPDDAGTRGCTYATGFVGGAGAGADYVYGVFDDVNSYLQINWHKNPTQGGGVTNGGANRATYIENASMFTNNAPHARGSAFHLNGRAVIVSFLGRVGGTIPLSVIPIIWQSAPDKKKNLGRGDGTYELYESSGKANLKQLAGGAATSANSCPLTNYWSLCRKVVFVPQIEPTIESASENQYTGVGIDIAGLNLKEVSGLYIANFQVEMFAGGSVSVFEDR